MLFTSKAVFFDIDGTLIVAPGSGREALARATAATFRRDLEQCRQRLGEVDFRGATDGTIVARYGELLELPLLGDARLVAAYLDALDEVLDETEVTLLPGVEALLEALGGRHHTHFGLLTGNIREAARRKLARVGLDHLVDHIGAFGDDGHDRTEIVAAALEQSGAVGAKPWATLIVGDSPRDIQAAHHWGAPAVAVATGWNSRAELAACGPQLLLDNLAEAGPLLNLLDGI